MDSSGAACGKFSMGFCMSGSVQDDECCVLSHLQTHRAVSQRRIAMGCAQGLCVLSWGAGSEAAGRVWGQVWAVRAPG